MFFYTERVIPENFSLLANQKDGFLGRDILREFDSGTFLFVPPVERHGFDDANQHRALHSGGFAEKSGHNYWPKYGQ